MYLASFADVLSYAGYIAIAVIVLLFMITVHEFGHYLIGKLFRFGIDEFSIGFGPAVFKRKRKSGETFSLRVLPFGGYCAFHGEDKDEKDEKAFNNFAPYKRVCVLIAGALMNYIVAVLIIVIMFFSYGQNVFKVSKIVEDGQYAGYSLQEGDSVIKIEGKNVYLTTDLINALLNKQKGEKVTFTVEREGEIKDITVIMREKVSSENVEDIKSVYLALGTYEKDQSGFIYGGLNSSSLRFGFFETVGRSFEYSFKLAGTVFTILGQLLTGRLGLNAVGGTITTISVTANAIKTGGLNYLLYISSFIGVNLAVFNLLPIPALDGARTVFTVIEWIRKKPLNRKVEGIIHTVGFVLILLFAVIVDLQHCF